MHVAGFKYHEIAEKMELPLGTVKSRIFFARQRLQVTLFSGPVSSLSEKYRLALTPKQAG